MVDSNLQEIPENSGILIDMQYPKLHFKNAIKECLLRKEVIEKLLEAKKYLPEELTFKIWDAYRPLELQKELYETYKSRIIKEFELENLSTNEQEKIINQYVSPADKDALHASGGAIDLTLAYKNTGENLNMGTDFDSFSKLTHTNAFENNERNIQIRDNRRILYNAMTKVGFVNLPTEYWHYDYGNKNWANFYNKPILYDCITKKK